ncbi:MULTISPECIES: hypothetical protein [Myxococcus]|uniref:Lipoprotein n=1 Tax=Myxococcus llanfairpwllgwyngyllgogerychwyrndrobwllllantysiliogogogochensis TaxID=2590453 RepID=A0A540WV46_9BACT|nr:MULTISPECIES: hypothetical protein [Myxococcus]NTX00861.1 hypothetical protein [Myxococcus sp. CA040A]TQF12817.1 hypothetical protein FJV41_27215 [Myxococcus llanfairpwllgwyngyllgogerychwyrndrobwllllantysiliogogogochensis]
MFSAFSRPLRCFAATAALLSLAACGDDDTKDPVPEPLACDAQTYTEAVRHAAEPTTEDISTQLWAISPSNPNLVWNETKTAVRMAIWTTFQGYTLGANTLSREVWVTAAPQLQTFCKTVSAENLVPRVNQYLGLPPATEGDNARYIVELWVKPGDMFRPCPDSEIDDGTCGLQFPTTATTEHKNWINANFASSYGFWQKTQYPWTGLGYTYDWCNADTRVGASEFVVRATSIVEVTGKFERAVYCAQ